MGNEILIHEFEGVTEVTPIFLKSAAANRREIYIIYFLHHTLKTSFCQSGKDAKMLLMNTP